MKPLVMIRDSLQNLPALDAPVEYVIRPYRTGDESDWERIVAASFETPRSFREVMRNDPSFRSERILFAEKDGVPVATAAAWYHPLWGYQYGYLHFVGVVPQHRGRHLGYWVSLAALYRFVEEGRTMAALETEYFRIAAIKIYLRLGFRPELTDQSRTVWMQLAEANNLSLNLEDSLWLNDYADQW